MSFLNTDVETAAAFLKRLDASEQHTFQLIHDSKKNSPAKILHGTIWDHVEDFNKAQKDGYGVYVCVNKTDLRGRKEKNITAIRAIVADLDGAPKENIARFGLRPSVTVESSPGKYHAWWFTSGVELEQYTPIMERMAALLESDHKICDLPRVLRVPGFYHQKGEPFLSQILEETPNTYTVDQIEEELKLCAQEKSPPSLSTSALEDACDKISKAKEGERNDTMFKQVTRIMRLIKKRLLSREDALPRLIDAAAEFKDGEATILEQFHRADRNIQEEVPVKEIILETGREADIAREIIEQLINTGKVMQRARQLVSPKVDFKHFESNNAFLSPLNHETILEVLNGGVIFTKHDGRSGKTKLSKLTHEQSDHVLKIGSWPNVPVCEGVINTPTMRPNGSILATPGYDALTGYYLELDPKLNLPTIQDHPTKEDALKAKDKFFSLLSEVAFNSDLDRAVALSAALTLVSRAAYRHAPMFLMSASTSGTGKSYLVKLLTTLACGSPAPVVGFSAYADELEKRLDSLILDGISTFSIDNIEEPLSGPPKLCQMISEDTISVRRLGTSTSPSCSFSATIFATGNGIDFARDMVRRGLTCRLNAKMERPEERQFTTDPMEELQKNRGEYVAALLTIIRASLSTPPQRDTTQFRQWARFARTPVIWLGLPDPIISQVEARASDEDTNLRNSFLNFLLRRYPPNATKSNRIRVANLISDVEKGMSNPEYGIPSEEYSNQYDYLKLTSGNNQGGISKLRLGHFLRSLNGVYFSNVSFVRLPHGEAITTYIIRAEKGYEAPNEVF